MLNRSASLAMSTSVLKAEPDKLDIKRHSPSIIYVYDVIINNDLLQHVCLVHMVISVNRNVFVQKISHATMFMCFRNYSLHLLILLYYSMSAWYIW